MYCQQWKVEVNQSKSKVLYVNKCGRITSSTFTIGDKPLELAKSYTYLGLEITNTGSFKLAQSTLYKKAMRALFKLKGMLRGTGLSPSVILDLFDHLIKPIALYGCEIWGIDFLNFNSAEKLGQSLTSPMCEKLNLSLCRYILGVHKTAQSSACPCRAIGRFPLGIDIIGSITKYHQYLLAKEEGTLMYEAFKLGKELARSCPNQTRLWQRRYLLMEQVLKPDSCTSISKYQAVNRSKRLYTDEWNKCMHREPKMRTYRVFKSSFEKETYLSISNIKQRNAMSRFRISAHHLAIEQGRYKRCIYLCCIYLCCICNNLCTINVYGQIKLL